MLEIITSSDARLFHGLIPAKSGVRFSHGAPMEFCLKNDSDEVGYFGFEKWTEASTIVYVSANIRPCEPDDIPGTSQL